MTDGLDFERQVHVLLKKMGFEADVTKASGDGGIDIIAHSKEHITGGKYIIQCKDWSKPVGEPPVRDLYGVVTAENANKGILITTSIFTSPAIKFAEGKPLELIDGTKFNQLLLKYGLTEIKGESYSVSDEERIEELIEELNKNPKNILIMKELADMYLLQGIYDKAIELYERLERMMPSVETERLNRAYWGGLNNYGVALAKQKRYDEALAIFKRLQKLNYAFLIYPSFTNEAQLVLYLGLYDIAISLFEKLKFMYEDPDIVDAFNRHIEIAYIEDQPTLSALLMVMDLDIEKANPELPVIPLDTAWQKTAQEGNQATYQGLIEAYWGLSEDIIDFLNEFISTLKSGNPESEGVESTFYKLLEIKDKSSSAITNHGHVAGVVADNYLQECYKNLALNILEALTLIHDGISKCLDLIKASDYQGDAFSQILKVFQQAGKDETIVTLNKHVNKELRKVEVKWEKIINKGKTEWREKLRNTLYASWSVK